MVGEQRRKEEKGEGGRKEKEKRKKKKEKGREKEKGRDIEKERESRGIFGGDHGVGRTRAAVGWYAAQRVEWNGD